MLPSVSGGPKGCSSPPLRRPLCHLPQDLPLCLPQSCNATRIRPAIPSQGLAPTATASGSRCAAPSLHLHVSLQPACSSCWQSLVHTGDVCSLRPPGPLSLRVIDRWPGTLFFRPTRSTPLHSISMEITASAATSCVHTCRTSAGERAGGFSGVELTAVRMEYTPGSHPASQPH